ncbi:MULTISPECIES: hypothetical protein [unclassified Acinetobacter]|uniref:hypothetical protein n=1 Tax=unclassified Acinetobacter TaxID=196816 RepID=UPI0035B96C34
MFAKYLLLIPVFTLSLTACNRQPSAENEQRAAIRPAVKLTNDATAVANEAWVLMNQVDQMLYSGDNADLENSVRKPVRELTLRWKTEVKMTDSVTEGKYALCRKALNSLDVWARAVQNKQDPSSAKADYERDKNLCKSAIEHPEQGNTSPKELKERNLPASEVVKN